MLPPEGAARVRASSSSPPSTLAARLTRLLVYAASFKALAGLAIAPARFGAWQAQWRIPIPLWVYLLHILVFAGAAAVLVWSSRRDRRALYLAGAYLAIAAAFADPLLRLPVQTAASLGAAVSETLADIQPVAFLALFIWLFVEEFPRNVTRPGILRLVRSFEILSFAVAILLVIAGLMSRLAAAPYPRWVVTLARDAPHGHFWTLIFGLSVLALPILIWKARLADRAERRRVRLFAAGLVVGGAPVLLEVVLEGLIPPFGRFMSHPAALLAGGFLVYPLILSVPVTTTYAVLAHRALDVRLVVRSAVQYALARNSIRLVALIPSGWLASYLWRHRETTLADLLSGPQALGLLLASGIAMAALRLRKPLLEGIDRRFFREQFDASSTLARLAVTVRGVASPAELAGLLTSEIDRALHLYTLSVLLPDPVSRTFLPHTGHVPPLERDSPLAQRAAVSRKPLRVGLDGTPETSGALSSADRQWIADGGLAVVVPLVASDGAPLGLIALGEKRSELPLSREDRALLGAIGDAASLALENCLLRSRTESRDAEDGWAADGVTGAPDRAAGRAAEDGPAMECAACGTVHPPDRMTCPACDSGLAPARLPYQPGGKFRVLRRLGAGGMGVVYEAEDLILARRVAVKTLPRLSPERILRLRREARAMAAVSHPNLAPILSAESWRGTPLLVLEFLEGGTLDQRLTDGPLEPTVAIRLGIALATALEHLHDRAILHRDVKPSNVGYGSDGTPKLLDFGLARILLASSVSAGEDGATPPSGEASPLSSLVATPEMTAVTAAGRLVGTPLYLSPEALRGRTPSPALDLWSLALVLYETVAGVNPLRGDSLQETFQRILDGHLPDVATLRENCPKALAGFLGRALHRRPDRRPRTARQMRRELQRMASA